MKLFDGIRAAFTFRPNRVTATANGSSVDTQGFRDGMVVLEVGTVSGTSPTLAVRLQDSPDNSTFTDIPGAVFTTVTASNNTQVLRLRELNVARARFVRAVATIGGTTPSYDFGCEILMGEPYAGPVNND
jgi:hypothetical protein